MTDKRIIFIQEHLSKSNGLNYSHINLAKLINISPDHLRHLFKSETGYSITQYQLHLKLENSKYLLRNTFLTVKEVAFKSGIPDQSKFCRYFKAKFGMTPKEYRNSQENQ